MLKLIEMSFTEMGNDIDNDNRWSNNNEYKDGQKV